MTNIVPTGETTTPTTLEHPQNGLVNPEGLLSYLEVARAARANGIIMSQVLPVFRQQLAEWAEENLTKLIRFEAIEISLIVPAKATCALGEYGWEYLITWLSTQGWHVHNHGVANGELHLWVKRYVKPTASHQLQLLDDLERRSPLR